MQLKGRYFVYSIYFILLTAVGIVSLLVTNKNADRPEVDVEEHFYPNEWMYAQRAYPDHQLNHEKFKQAVRHTLSAKAEVSPRNEDSWTQEGPLNVGGRITDVALNPVDTNIIYVGASVGGVFKSEDGGDNWMPIFENAGSLSIGDIAVSSSQPEVLYVGTGEANGSASSGAFFGDGIYKSTDGGNSWAHAGLENSYHIGRIAIDHQNSDRAYVAVAGLLYGKSEDKGLYRTTDGGKNWEKVLFLSDSTSCIDVVIHPHNADTVYAATWERIRAPWQRKYGGVTSGIHRSYDGGTTWEQLTEGLPTNDDQCGRIGISISHSDPHTLYASLTTNVITNVFEGIYKSTDGGDTWAPVNDNILASIYGSFGWFFGNIRVDPNDSEVVYAMGVTLWKSINGGDSWSYSTGSMHVDQHGLEIHPMNSKFLVAGNDGGVYLSHDGGLQWTHIDVLPITQFYTCEVNNSNPSSLYGGTQDNGTIRTLDGELDSWGRIFGGDGFVVKVDPFDPSFVYAESQWGNLARSLDGGENFQPALDGINSDDRTNWKTPFVLAPSDPSTLYYGTYRLYRSMNHAQTWEVISEDLTDGLHPSGSLSYGTLSTIDVAPSNSSVIYVGTDDGNVQVTFDGGMNWTNISSGLPDRYITQVAVDYEDELTAYVTVSGYRQLDYLPHILKTTDGGENWFDISGNLPEIPLNDVIIDPDQDSTLYVANDLGVWFTTNFGQHWEVLGDNLPMTIVNDLTLHKDSRTLIAATFGRSMFTYQLADPPSSVEEVAPLENEKFLRLFPNPVKYSAQVSVNLPSAEYGLLELYDLKGQFIQEVARQNFSKGESRFSINVSHLPAGSYLLRLITEKGILTVQCVVAH
ncbi:MAG: T9SS type A sorting domain-containing protein [Bacteroidetes bacterium]|nr:T9SS type A sorting domain-containing protein [Bacteroidota bacterium]